MYVYIYTLVKYPGSGKSSIYIWLRLFKKRYILSFQVSQPEAKPDGLARCILTGGPRQRRVTAVDVDHQP